MKAEVTGREIRERLEATLSFAAEALHLSLSAEQTKGLLDFVSLLARWNSTYNLTSVRDTERMLAQHVIDCLAAVPALRRELAARSSVAVLDVGSGAGLPGLVIAVMQAEAVVTCVESVGKKAAFIQQAAGTLGLTNVRVQRGRVEDLGGETYDLITSRAFGALSRFVDLTDRVLAPAGAWMAMKGKRPDREIETLPPWVAVFHVEPLEVPGLAADRCLVWLKRRLEHIR